MILDSTRTSSYVEALRAAIRPGNVVLDIGAGTGIFAFAACQFGARKVYAIESGNVIGVAQEVVAASGLKERIEFIPKASTEVVLPEQVDVVVSDIHGVLPVHESGVLSILDARERFLAPGGTLIPQRDTLRAALVNVSRLYRRLVKPWENDSYGVDMRPVRKRAVNHWAKCRLTASDLVCAPQSWATLDYRTLTTPSVRGEILSVIESEQMAHGIAIWFDCETSNDIGFSNSPACADARIYGQLFFPWPAPIELSKGDEVLVRLRAELVGVTYIWCWDTQVTGTDKIQKAAYRQSTLQGSGVLPAQLEKRSHNYIPGLSEDGRIDGLVLEQIGSGMTLEEISRQVAFRFPERFENWKAALSRVGDLSARYSQ